MTDKTAFELGFDLYIYALGSYLDEIQHPQVSHGYEAAEMQGVHHKLPDIFVKKWLSIRARCLRLGRDISITPADIEKALSLTGRYCQVTLEPFTYGEMQLTDWSIDRIDNGYGYHPGNILVISSRANRAKGDLSLTDMIRATFSRHREAFMSHPDQANLLDTAAWFRLAALYMRHQNLDGEINYSAEVKLESPDVFREMVACALGYCEVKATNPFSRALYQSGEVSRRDVEKLIKWLKKKRVQHIIKHHEEPPRNLSIIQRDMKMARIFLTACDAVLKRNQVDNAMMPIIFNLEALKQTHEYRDSLTDEVEDPHIGNIHPHPGDLFLSTRMIQ